MSLRLVKQQLAALSKDQIVADKAKSEPKEARLNSKLKHKKDKIKKKHQKKEKALAKNTVSEEIRQINLAFYKKTVAASKSKEAMMKVNLDPLICCSGLYSHEQSQAYETGLLQGTSFC